MYIELDDDYSEEEMIKLDMMYDDLNKFLKTNFLQEYVALYLRCLLKQEDKKRIMIIADEFHLFIDEENPEVLRNFGQINFQLNRK